MGELWLVWRLVAAGVATLQEIDSHYSVTDVLDANEALDVWDDLKPRPPTLPLSIR